MDEKDFKAGDWVVIDKAGWGTSEKDVGLVCRIVTTKTDKSNRHYYPVEIDRDKEGNNDRFTSVKALRRAESHEIPVLNNYQIY